MSWAARRRFIIVLILGVLAALIAGLFLFFSIRTTPSCVDGTMNGTETGVDCGGSCPYLCIADEQPPTVLFTAALPSRNGSTDVVALVENKNATAGAKSVPYTLILYGAGQSLIQKTAGTFDLPPGDTVPIYALGIASGKQAVTRAFLSIDASAFHWISFPSDPRIVPSVTHTVQGGTADAPRIEATLTNPSVRPLSNVKVVVLVRGAQGNVIAASQTIVPSIPGQGSASATFTWNAAFSEPATSIQAVPVIPLP